MTRGAGAVALAAVWLLASPARAEVVRIESLGAAPAREHAPEGISLQRAAVGSALEDAVVRAALGLLDAERDPAARKRVVEALGEDPMRYTVRYRLLEDRGERRRLLVRDLEVEWEYVVLVEAHVALDRVRERLVQARLLVPGAAVGTERVRVEIEGLRSWSDYELVRQLLASRARAIRPLEFTRGRVVLELETDRHPSNLLRDLRYGLPPRLAPAPLAIDADALRLRLGEPTGGLRRGRRPPAAAAPGASERF